VASAVVVFAVPASPLAQPRAVVGGNVISALIGVACGLLIPHAWAAGPVAAALAIAAMLVLGCLHPPGAAVAFVAAAAQGQIGWDYALTPIGLGSALLCLAGAIYAPLVGRVYPHKPPTLGAMGLATPEPATPMAAGAGVLAGVNCGAVMTAELIFLTPQMDAETALKVLTDHALRSAPVLGEGRRVLGLARRAELLLEVERDATEGAGAGRSVGALADPDIAAVTRETPLAQVLPMLASGGAHEVVVVDGAGAAVGVITQTDVLKAVLKGAG
jgi:CBS domain-containing membrane protein